MNAIDIHKDIEANLGLDAIDSSTVTKCLRETQVTHNSGPTPTSIEDECQRVIDKSILIALAEGPFASVRRIASKTPIPRTTIYRHLVGPVGMIVKPLGWDAPRPSPQQKGRRVRKV
jgi:hypothetical protein